MPILHPCLNLQGSRRSESAEGLGSIGSRQICKLRKRVLITTITDGIRDVFADSHEAASTLRDLQALSHA